MTKHTPGPWRFCEGKMKWNDTTSDALIVDAGQHTSDIAWIPARFEDAPNMEATQIANARLIAAAPDMLAALEAEEHAQSLDEEYCKNRPLLPRSERIEKWRDVEAARHYAGKLRAVAIAKVSGESTK